MCSLEQIASSLAQDLLWGTINTLVEKISSSVLDSFSLEQPLLLQGLQWGSLVPEQVVLLCFSFEVFGFAWIFNSQCGGRAGVGLSSQLCSQGLLWLPGNLSMAKSQLCLPSWELQREMEPWGAHPHTDGAVIAARKSSTEEGECAQRDVWNKNRSTILPLSSIFHLAPVSLIPSSSESMLANLIGTSGLFSLQVPLIIGLLSLRICAVGAQLLQWKYYFLLW